MICSFAAALIVSEWELFQKLSCLLWTLIIHVASGFGATALAVLCYQNKVNIMLKYLLRKKMRTIKITTKSDFVPNTVENGSDSSGYSLIDYR